MKILTRFTNVASSIGGILAGVGITAIVLIVIYDVLARYLFGRPSPFAFDLSVSLLASAIFLGLAYTFIRGAHIRMELVVGRLPRTFQSWVRLVTYVIGLGFLAVLTPQSWAFAARSSGELPLYIPLIVMALGLSLFMLIILFTIGQQVWLMVSSKKGGESREAIDTGGRKGTQTWN